MKRCPTCNRAFTDDTLSFCLEDGTPLISERPAGPDSEATLVSPSPRAGGDPTPGMQETQLYNPMPGRPAGAGAGYQTPAAYVAQTAQRKVWPWVVAVVALFVVGVGIILAALVLIPRLADHSTNSNGEGPVPTPVATSSPSESPEPTSSVDNGEAPTDHDQVLSDLEDLEEEWERANVEGDKEALEAILADEYQGDNNSSKKSYLESLTPHPGRTWKYSNFALDLEGNRAILTYHLDRITGENVDSASYIDVFVWRDGRWQATSSRQVR